MSIRLAASVALVCAYFVCLAPQSVLAQFIRPVIRETGRSLFIKQWKHNDLYDETGADGLGPLFNADSCVACHNLGGVGGAGDNSTNVQIVSILPRQTTDGVYRTDDQAVTSMFANASKLHPDFSSVNSTVLHRSSIHELEFAKWQQETLAFKSLKKAKDDQVAEKLLVQRTRLLDEKTIYRVKKDTARNRYTVQISRRNTPALFGVSTIDAIHDEDIRVVALRQSKQPGPVKGVVAELPNGKVGKFGWRGEKATVREFTVQACAIELGLSNSQHKQADLPFVLSDRQHGILTPLLTWVPGDQDSIHDKSITRNTVEALRPKPEKEREHDMTDQQVDDMIHFVKSLRALIPIDAKPAELESIVSGRNHFNTIGCSECHVRNIGPAHDVFSDFLLHDMGKDLADAAGSLRFLPGTANIKAENDRRWQTPPLWGAALSAPYLHDGRAKDFHTAITMHGGEASESQKEYKLLSQDEKKQLLSFLKTLGDGAREARIGRPAGVARGGWSSPQPRRGMLAGRRR